MSTQTQPDVTGLITWGITSLTISEPPGSVEPSTIVPAGNDFDLKVQFDGSGATWVSHENGAQPFTVNFYAEGLGANALEIDFGNQTGNLGAGPYDVTKTISGGISIPGVYRVACTVSLDNYPEVAGFSDDLLIRIT
jgi:hypothetical protein